MLIRLLYVSFDILSFPFVVIASLSMTHNKDGKTEKVFHRLLLVKTTFKTTEKRSAYFPFLYIFFFYSQFLYIHTYILLKTLRTNKFFHCTFFFFRFCSPFFKLTFSLFLFLHYCLQRLKQKFTIITR